MTKKRLIGLAMATWTALVAGGLVLSHRSPASAQVPGPTTTATTVTTVNKTLDIASLTLNPAPGSNCPVRRAVGLSGLASTDVFNQILGSSLVAGKPVLSGALTTLRDSGTNPSSLTFLTTDPTEVVYGTAALNQVVKPSPVTNVRDLANVFANMPGFGGGAPAGSTETATGTSTFAVIGGVTGTTTTTSTVTIGGITFTSTLVNVAETDGNVTVNTFEITGTSTENCNPAPPTPPSAAPGCAGGQQLVNVPTRGPTCVNPFPGFAFALGGGPGTSGPADLTNDTTTTDSSAGNLPADTTDLTPPFPSQNRDDGSDTVLGDPLIDDPLAP